MFLLFSTANVECSRLLSCFPLKNSCFTQLLWWFFRFFTEHIEEVRNQLLAQGRAPKVYPSSATQIRTLCFDKIRLHLAPPQWEAIKERCRIAGITWYHWMRYGALASAIAAQADVPLKVVYDAAVAVAR